jgi:hypothetical protein
MSDVTDRGADNFCPACGVELGASVGIAVSEDMPTTGLFEKRGGCVIVDEGEVRIYAHEGEQ